jgi:hypothetical protein
MRTRKFCPKCGRPLYKSQTRGYAFQCFGCDKDFYRFEVYRIKDLSTVNMLQRATYFDELSDPISLPAASVKKPYRRPQSTKNQKVNNHGKNP